MSALTKIFVVLLVVMSLLLSAGLIVFVNHQENFKQTAKDAGDKLKVAEQHAVLVDQENQKVKNQLLALAQEKDAQIAAARTETLTAQGAIAQRDTQIAELQQNLAQATAGTASTAEALKVAQAANQQMATNFTELRTAADKDRKQLVEANLRINELTNEVDVVRRHDRFNGEQVAQLSSRNTELENRLRQYNISTTPGAPQPGAINNTPAININGEITQTRDVNGVQYATISLGSADQVTRGMEFKVIDPRSKTFLGYLTVDSVEPHAAVGHLRGPAVAQVRQHAEVRTQL